MITSQRQQSSHIKSYPPASDNNWLCLGFFLFKPSQTMFDYYIVLRDMEGHFEPLYPDQIMLTYAHWEDVHMP
jgi:hypothetical protein